MSNEAVEQKKMSTGKKAGIGAAVIGAVAAGGFAMTIDFSSKDQSTNDTTTTESRTTGGDDNSKNVDVKGDVQGGLDLSN